MGSDCAAARTHYGLIGAHCCEECHDEADYGEGEWFDVFDEPLRWYLCCAVAKALEEHLDG